ncbi:unnamed protein product, partial [Prorocentrum cordatum]
MRPSWTSCSTRSRARTRCRWSWGCRRARRRPGALPPPGVRRRRQQPGPRHRQHALRQRGAGRGRRGAASAEAARRAQLDEESRRSPRMDPLGELLGCSDSEPWNDLLHRFCIQGDESIVEVLLDHLVQSGRDAGALIEALASADLAGLEGVVAEVTAGSAA